MCPITRTRPARLLSQAASDPPSVSAFVIHSNPRSPEALGLTRAPSQGTDPVRAQRSSHPQCRRPGPFAALPLSLSAPKRKSDRRRHEARRDWSFVDGKAGAPEDRPSLGDSAGRSTVLPKSINPTAQ
jgi:hypothetical protein